MSRQGPVTKYFGLIWDSPIWRARFPYICPRNRVTQLYPRALGSLFVVSYDLQQQRWRYWTRLYTGSLILRPKVSRPVCLGARPSFGGPWPHFCFLSNSLTIAWLLKCVALSDESTGLFAVQSFTDPSRTGPISILYYIIWDSPNLEDGVPIFISPRNGVPFCRLLRLAGLRWRYSSPPPHGSTLCNNTSAYNF
jgi:hypothetical protein